MAVFSLFSGADPIGEFETLAEAERALDKALSADPPAADKLAVFEFGGNGERVGEPITPRRGLMRGFGRGEPSSEATANDH